MATFAGGFTSLAPAAANGSNDNKGDVWADNVGNTDTTPAMHPHLACSDIAVWGMKLHDAGGPFTIQGWPPSGGGASELDFSGTWTYDLSGPNLQQIATVSVDTLLANAMAAGDTAQPQQGFHFKLDLEDPRTNSSIGDDKYKVFWIGCPTSTPTPTASVAPTTPTPTPTPTPPTPTPTPPTPTPTSTVGAITSSPSPGESTPTPTPSSGVMGITTTTPTGGVAGLTTPNTGSSLPLGLSGGLMAFGLSLLAVGRRLKPRSRR